MSHRKLNRLVSNTKKSENTKKSLLIIIPIIVSENTFDPVCCDEGE